MLGFGALSELPIGDSAASSGSQVSGWKATKFGIPSLPLEVQGWSAARFGTPIVRGAYPVTGFAPVQFGTPRLLPHAVALRPVQFGIPRLLPHAVALRPVSFGTPVAIIRNRVASWRATRFGTPAIPTARTVAVSGFECVHFGHPVAIRYTSRARHLHGHVSPLRPARFGTPSI